MACAEGSRQLILCLVRPYRVRAFVVLLLSASAVVAQTPESLPDDTIAGYDDRVQQWFARFDPIHDTAIADLTASPDGSLQIRFFGGGEIFVPSDESEREDLWYDHWY